MDNNVDIKNKWIISGEEIENIISQKRNEKFQDTGVEPSILVFDNYTYVIFCYYQMSKLGINKFGKLNYYEGLSISVIVDPSLESQVIEIV
jgi:hypothetical protein